MSEEARTCVVSDELRSLTAAMCNGVILPHQRDRLEELLSDDADACEFYVSCLAIHAQLLWRHRGRTEQVIRLATAEAPKPALFGFPGTPLHNAFGYISSGWPLAYVVATAILGIGLLIGSFMPTSGLPQIAKQSSPPSRLSVGPRQDLVGRITGMVDCQWADPNLAPLGHGTVSVGRKYAIKSGLMEISYDTGARVILQGPVVYEVDSASGGLLSVGKLTATVENKMASRQSPPASGSNPQSSIPNPSLSTLHSPLFTIRTPTATVIDLGTEFGVEVDGRGYTTSHVFRGTVRVQAIASAGMPEGVAEVLHENQSARVESRDGRPTIIHVSSTRPAAFVREIPRLTIKTLDLADVVAGGDGFSGRQDAGIDPRNGRLTTVWPKEHPLRGDKKYHRVEGLPFVDGVFIPYSGDGPVQLDSAGHRFAWFPKTENWASGLIWAGKDWNLRSEVDGVDYAAPGHRVLGFDANKGITFDLAAIRRANPGWKLVRFRAMGANTEPQSEKGKAVWADLWVFVDGEVRFQRREINRYSGGLPAAVPIKDSERFLTLVSTDGGNTIWYDHTMFGDPRLEMVPAPSTTEGTPPGKKAEH